MILMDLHAHSSGISTCCRICGKLAVDEAISSGLGGFVLTNHYTEHYVGTQRYSTYEDFADEYVEEYRRIKEYGDGKGFSVFFGVEITSVWDDAVHLLVYGVPTSFVTDHPRMCLYSFEQLYDVVHQYGGILIQAHPYRIQPRLQDLKYLDGVEISCHPHLRYGGSFTSEMKQIAQEHGKLLTCGGDYHGDVSYRPQCGVFVPKELTDTVALKDWLLAQKSLTLRVHEPGGDWHDVFYQRI